MNAFSADAAADLLVVQFRQGTKTQPAMSGPGTRGEAYQVQDRMIAALGGACGWKVGRAKTDPEPYCAPVPASRLLNSGGDYARFHGVAQVEAELGYRLGRDVPPSAAVLDRAECAALVDAIVPALEILETRLEPPAAQDPLWKLADLQANGALVVGKPVPWAGQDPGQVRLAIGSGQDGAFEGVAHPFGAPFDLFCWTVNHVARQRGGLKRGDVIITGSYCGIVEIRDPQRFVATFADYGDVCLTVL